MCEKCNQAGIGLTPEFETLLHHEYTGELTTEMEYETPGGAPAVSRRSSQYVKWVQQSLNRILGVRLDVDGISGPLTRSAVRSFQKAKGLTVDGIVGVNTERALLIAIGNPGMPPGIPVSPTTPTIPQQPVPGNSNIPPTEGPLPGITGYIGRSGKKCWDKQKSADIIDADAPWNTPSNRSAANYSRVLDYLNVGKETKGNTFTNPSENPRYRQKRNDKGGISTYCNIYVHDATRMMWANIPHWVPTSRGGTTEMGANSTVEWMLKNGSSVGWALINAPFKAWMTQQNGQQTRLPDPGLSLSNNVATMAQHIAVSNHNNPANLNQASYIAQQFANRGYPTVAIWKNAGGIGHVTMVRPEGTSGRFGEDRGGVFVPVTAQAGASNFSNDLSVFKASTIKSGALLFFVHE